MESTGQFIDNVAASNTMNGIQFYEIYGTVTGNTATYNGNTGIEVDGLFGTLSDNLASNNTVAGFTIFELFNGATFTDNRSIDNGNRGYWVPIDWGGTSSNNTGSGNPMNNTYP